MRGYLTDERAEAATLPELRLAGSSLRPVRRQRLVDARGRRAGYLPPRPRGATSGSASAMGHRTGLPTGDLPLQAVGPMRSSGRPDDAARDAVAQPRGGTNGRAQHLERDAPPARLHYVVESELEEPPRRRSRGEGRGAGCRPRERAATFSCTSLSSRPCAAGTREADRGNQKIPRRGAPHRHVPQHTYRYSSRSARTRPSAPLEEFLFRRRRAKLRVLRGRPPGGGGGGWGGGGGGGGGGILAVMLRSRGHPEQGGGGLPARRVEPIRPATSWCG